MATPKTIEHRIPGLNEPGEIVVDRWGIPHIRARTRHDVFFLQGLNAARDRLWQIDLWRKRGLGLLAADFGPGFLAQDRAARPRDRRKPAQGNLDTESCPDEADTRWRRNRATEAAAALTRDEVAGKARGPLARAVRNRHPPSTVCRLPVTHIAGGAVRVDTSPGRVPAHAHKRYQSVRQRSHPQAAGEG